MSQADKPAIRINWQHVALLSFGILIFILLILADKRNLDKEQELVAVDTNTVTAPLPPEVNENSSLPAAISSWEPSVPLDDTLEILFTRLDKFEDVDRFKVYKQIVEVFRKRGQYYDAAVQGALLAEEEPNLNNYLVAGALFRNANLLEEALADTAKFRSTSKLAIQHMEKAAGFNPNDEKVLIELGLSYIESRDMSFAMEGIMKLREVLKINPKNEEALFRLGGFSMQTQQYDKAENRFREVLKINPRNDEARYYLAISLLNLGNRAEFQKLMNEIVTKSEDPRLVGLAQEMLNRN